MPENRVTPGMKRARKAIFNANRETTTNRQRTASNRVLPDPLGTKVSRRKRSWSSPYRYQPRCKNKQCVAPLPHGQHVGVCEDCRAAVIAALGGGVQAARALNEATV
jgi:hypothetical protein